MRLSTILFPLSILHLFVTIEFSISTFLRMQSSPIQVYGPTIGGFGPIEQFLAIISGTRIAELLIILEPLLQNNPAHDLCIFREIAFDAFFDAC
jgi:hypothetical protein